MAEIQVTSEHFDLFDKPMVDNSISKKELYEIKHPSPEATSNLSFQIDYTDQWVLPHEAFLEFSGSIVKADNSAYDANDKIAFVNNGLMHVFNRATYKLNNQAIETIESPGTASLITSLVDYPKDFMKTVGEQYMLVKDTGTNAATDANTGFTTRKGLKKFNCCVPLAHTFRFCKDVSKAMYGLTHTIELNKEADSSNALFRAAGVDAGKVTFTSISLWMPRLTPSPSENLKLLKGLNSKRVIQAPFEQVKYYELQNQAVAMKNPSWDICRYTPTDRPRHVFVTFQNQNRRSSQQKNNAVFDHCSVKDIRLIANGEYHPRVDYSIDFANKLVGRPFRDLLEYRGVSGLYDSGMSLDRSDFKDRYPIFYFNLEHLGDEKNLTSSSLQLRATLNSTAEYSIIAVVLADKDLRFTSDGQKMEVSLR